MASDESYRRLLSRLIVVVSSNRQSCGLLSNSCLAIIGAGISTVVREVNGLL